MVCVCVCMGEGGGVGKGGGGRDTTTHGMSCVMCCGHALGVGEQHITYSAFICALRPYCKYGTCYQDHIMSYHVTRAPRNNIVSREAGYLQPSAICCGGNLTAIWCSSKTAHHADVLRQPDVDGASRADQTLLHITQHYGAARSTFAAQTTAMLLQ